MSNTKEISLKETIDPITKAIDIKSKRGLMSIPKDYDVAFALNTAFYMIAELKSGKESGFKPALEVCTPESIQDALVKMVTFGLNPAKKQVYFIVAKDKLKLLDSYFGDIAKAIRFGNLENDPICNIVYEGDLFETEIDTDTGHEKLVIHKRGTSRDMTKISGAYAMAKNTKGRLFFEYMDIAGIKRAWAKGNALMRKQNSEFQDSFTDRAVFRTVTRRLCNFIFNISADYPDQVIEIENQDQNETIDIQHKEVKQNTIELPIEMSPQNTEKKEPESEKKPPQKNKETIQQPELPLSDDFD